MCGQKKTLSWSSIQSFTAMCKLWNFHSEKSANQKTENTLKTFLLWHVRRRRWNVGFEPGPSPPTQHAAWFRGPSWAWARGRGTYATPAPNFFDAEYVALHLVSYYKVSIFCVFTCFLTNDRCLFSSTFDIVIFSIKYVLYITIQYTLHITLHITYYFYY